MKEIRQINNNIEIENRHISGYAAVFNSPSVPEIGWIETICDGAITDETIKSSDIFAKFNHDDNKILARSKNGEGSLTLTLDEHGLKYEFDAPNTALGDELLEYLKRGEITSSSFCFSISKEPNAEEWYKEDDQIYRKIYKIEKLYDVSPVFQPAYEDTTCSKRFIEIKNKVKDIENEMEIEKLKISLL